MTDKAQNEPDIGTLETEMNRGFLHILVLALLEKDMTAMRWSHIETLGYEVEENTLYPLLRRLEKNGWIASKWDLTEDRPRKFYSSLGEGRIPSAPRFSMSGRTRSVSSMRSPRRSPMSDKLEAYLEEISHFLSGRAEKGGDRSEIRSHIMEKAAEGRQEFTDAAIEKAIAAFGPAREVAEKYLDHSRPIIDPAYKRYSSADTTLLFAAHTLLTIAAVVFKEDFIIFRSWVHAPPRRHRSPDVLPAITSWPTWASSPWSSISSPRAADVKLP